MYKDIFEKMYMKYLKNLQLVSKKCTCVYRKCTMCVEKIQHVFKKRKKKK